MGRRANPPRSDWDPKGPKGKVRGRTFDEKVADDLREIERAKAEREQREKAEQARIKAHETEWMERRTRCHGSLGILSNEIKIRKNNWSNVVIDVCAAYESAYKAFSSKLSEETSHNQLMWSLAFTALGACAVGGIAVLVTKRAEKWATTDARRLFVDAAEDAIQAGTSGLFSVAAPLFASKYDASDIPSPFALKGELEKLLNEMETGMLQWCIDQQKLVTGADLRVFEHFDPQKLDEEIAAFLRDKDAKFNSQPFVFQVTKAELATELEKMMVGLWAAAFLEKELSRDRKVLLVLERQPARMPNKIIDRLADFGFVDKSGHYSDVDVLKIAKWGPNTERAMRATIQKVKSYKTKKFG